MELKTKYRRHAAMLFYIPKGGSDLERNLTHFEGRYAD
jgi:hypothetical protein